MHHGELERFAKSQGPWLMAEALSLPVPQWLEEESMLAVRF
jgi:hypothetical protein